MKANQVSYQNPEGIKMVKEEIQKNQLSGKENENAEKKELNKGELANKKSVEESKKIEAVVNAHNIPISTKHSVGLCRFIKKKKISQAISDLQEVLKMKKAVPMRGEIPHRHGRIMSGRFPRKATQEFIKLLKSLAANANYLGIENPIITKAVANIGERPFGRYGIRKKRTHVTLIAASFTGGKNDRGD